MRKSRVLLPLLLVVSLCSGFGCRKDHPPSPDYQKARTLWLDLLKDKMGKAYADPDAETVLSLLARVDPNSMDAESATRLRDEIEKGRAEAVADQAKLAAQLDQARVVSRPAFTGATAAVGKPGVDGGAVASDGGQGSDMPVPGMAQAEFEQKFSRCFEQGNDVVLSGVMGGKVWTLKDLGNCRDRYPRFLTNSVVIFNGKVESIRPATELAPKHFKMVEGKLVPMDESQYAAEKAANAKAVAATPPAPPKQESGMNTMPTDQVNVEKSNLPVTTGQ